MPEKRKPYEIIEDMVEVRNDRTNEAILAELEKLTPLPDEDHELWDDPEFWNTAAYPFLALCDQCSRRQLIKAIPLILDRVCYGDPGEIMRGLCHVLEGIVKPDYGKLFAPCAASMKSPRKGTRYWALFQLGRLRDKRAMPVLTAALNDEVEDIRSDAASWIERYRKEGIG